MANEMIGNSCSVAYVATRLGVSRQRVHQLITDGKLAATYASGRWWVRKDVADLFIQTRRQCSGVLDFDGDDGDSRAA